MVFKNNQQHPLWLASACTLPTWVERDSQFLETGLLSGELQVEKARRWSSPLLSVPIAQVKNWRMFFPLLADVQKEGYISQWVNVPATLLFCHAFSKHGLDFSIRTISFPCWSCLTSLQLPPYVHLSNFHLQVGLSGKWEERKKSDHKPCSEESDLTPKRHHCYNALGSKYRHHSRFSCWYNGEGLCYT